MATASMGIAYGDNISTSQVIEGDHVKHTLTVTSHDAQGKLQRLEHTVEWEMSDEHWIGHGHRVGEGLSQ